ncbi:PASTA domain-containing protein [bacterium]|nr:MAG: PASTA domain-containing protein [bacterium]
MRIDGLYVIKESSRIYSFGSLASQIIGFTDADNKGVSGIELAFNKELTGREGYLVLQRDGHGKKRMDLSYPQREALPGNNIILTIDKGVQEIAEEELAAGVSAHQAEKGKVVIISVKTGEVLAMASNPTFDPNNRKSEDSIGMKNTIISDIYEPGSTFKIITAAAAIEENLESGNSYVNTENGTFYIHDMKISDSYPSSSLTFQQVIERSSNIGVSKTSQKVGQEKFYKYARDFGFGIATGIELRGENRGMLKRPVDFTSGTLEFMSIGYQVSVNLLQIASAYAAIANKGTLMKPFIVRKELAPDGSLIYESIPAVVRQVVSEKTANTVNQFFTGVVERGTGTDARIDGFTVAGKTGTTQKIVNGEYSSSSHISSFVGYFPAENPVILIAVVLDDPKNEYYGGKVAAPIFKNIAAKIIKYYGMTNSGKSEYLNVNYVRNEEKKVSQPIETSGQILVPNLIDLKLQDALFILKEKNLKYEIEGFENKIDNKNLQSVVTEQYPEYNTIMANEKDAKIRLKIKTTIPKYEKNAKVPDVTNLSLRKAINKLISEGFSVEIVGSGEIIGQMPKQGTEQPLKSRIIIFCKNEIQ